MTIIKNNSTEDKSFGNLPPVLNHVSDLVFLVDKSGVIYDVNLKVADTLLYNPGEVIGKTFYNYFKVNENSYPQKDFNNLILSKKQRSLILLITRDNSLIITDIKVVEEPDSGLFMLFCGNISDLMRAEEKFYKTFEINSNLMSITTVDEGMFVDVNQAFVNTFEYEKDEIIGKNVSELKIYGFPEQRDKIVKELRKEGYINSFEISVKTKSGKTLEGLYSAELIFFQDKKYILATITDLTQKKLTEAKYKSYIQNAPDGVFLINDKGYFVEVNKTGLDITGYSEKQILELKISQLIDFKNIKNGLDGFFDLILRGKIEQEFTLKDKNGNALFVLLTAVKLTPERFIIFLKDISERKKVEKSLVESEGRFHSMFMEHDSIMLLINSSSGKIVDVNKFAEKFYGYKRKEFLSMNIQDINTGSEEEIRQMRINAVKKNINAFIASHKLSNGEIRKVEIHSSPINMNGETMLFAIIHDVNEKYVAEALIKKQESKLFEAKSLLDSVVDNIPFKIWYKDANGKYMMTNKLFDGYHNVKKQDVIGKTDFELVSKEWAEKFISSDKKAMSKRKPVTIEETIEENGETHWYETIKNPFYNDNGEVIGTIGISREITHRKKTEEELKSLVEQLKVSKLEMEEVNAEKDKFFSIIAHDLRSPLLGFLAFTGILSEQLYDLTMREMQDFSKKLQSSAAVLYRLLENLLEWSRIQRGFIKFNPVDTDLNLTISSNIDIMKQTASLKEISLDSNVPENIYACVDENMLNTILRNLLSNAIKYTPRNGRVAVSVIDEKNYITIKVIDTGIGIPEDKISALFKISEKVLRKGTEGEESTGLGLLLVKEYVEKHNGKIEVKSTEGKGSEFSFTLSKEHN